MCFILHRNRSLLVTDKRIVLSYSIHKRIAFFNINILESSILIISGRLNKWWSLLWFSHSCFNIICFLNFFSAFPMRWMALVYIFLRFFVWKKRFQELWIVFHVFKIIVSSFKHVHELGSYKWNFFRINMFPKNRFKCKHINWFRFWTEVFHDLNQISVLNWLFVKIRK